MAAILLATQGVARRLRGAHGGILLEVFGTLLAYTSKEQAIVLPAFVVIEAWVAAECPPLRLNVVGRLLRPAIPQLTIAVAYLAIRQVVLPVRGAIPGTWGLGVVGHIVLVFESFGRFVTLTFAPHDLSVQQGLVHFVGHGRQYNTAYLIVGLGSFIVLTTVAVMARKRAPAVTMGIAFYVATLTPTLNIVNTQMITIVSERFVYLPLLGPALAVGSQLKEVRRSWLFVLVAAAIVTFGVQSLRRAADFVDETSFWERELALHPESGEARGGRIQAALAKKRYRAALLETLELTRTANVVPDVTVAASVADLTARLTPDHDSASLEIIDTFCRELLERKQPEVVLKLHSLEYRIRTGSQRYEQQLQRQELVLLAQRSRLRARLKDDAGALALAQEGLNICPRCQTAIISAALALAKAARYDDAFAVLQQSRELLTEEAMRTLWTMIARSGAEMQHAEAATGPEQLRAHAAALGTLELWGRAYDVLAPYKDEIKQAPNFSDGFAELAFRAGESEVAREVLAMTKQPGEIDRIITEWTDSMGWME
jgi:hypothetical protein